MKIIVTSNCQTGGIAAILREIYNGTNVVAAPITMSDDALRSNLSKGDVWVTIGKSHLARDMDINVINIPAIHFGAFHPDICHAKDIVSGEITSINYNSNIVVWSYNNGLKISDAVALFNSNTFAKLGYYDSWHYNFNILKKSFVDSDFGEKEFINYWLKIKRKGCFMYSMNHPKIEALVELTKIVSRRINPQLDVESRVFNVVDALTETIWPVYPGIASELSIPGDYIWKMNGTIIYGLNNYVNAVYAYYENSGHLPGNLTIDYSECGNVDQVMRSIA